MDEFLIIDTDVLIDYLRGVTEAVEYCKSLTSPIGVSVITVAELYTGTRDRHEETQLDQLIDLMTVFAITHPIAKQGGLFRKQYIKSHAIEIPDALIAATVKIHGGRLVTLNKKHYPMLPDIMVPY